MTSEPLILDVCFLTLFSLYLETFYSVLAIIKKFDILSLKFGSLTI